MHIKFKPENLYGIGILLAANLLSSPTVQAQLLPDQTLPNNTAVNSEGNIYQINGGTVAGNNLFHSFEEFSVPPGQEASFNNNLAIQNVISRVTGESISTIDGAISANGNANLLLINPNGVIFGSNASLNIGGSLLVTSAESLQFADGQEFTARNPPASPLLTISTPAGLQFGSRAESITNQSGRLVLENSDNTIAFIGGDINLEGGTIANLTGNIELGSVASNSQVDIIPKDSGWTFDYDGVQNFGDISLTQAKNAVNIESDDSAVLIAADVRIQGKKVTIRDGSQILVNKTLQINASDTLELSGSVPSDFSGSPFFSGLISEAFFVEVGGDIVVNAGQLIIQDGARISSKASGDLNLNTLEFIPASGNGGDITINASKSIQVSDQGSGIFSSTEGFGSAGKITIQTKDLSLGNGAIISAESTGETDLGQSLSTGKGGEIQINSSESITLDGGFISSSTNGLGGNAGNLRLETNQLRILEGSEISVNASGTGAAGSLTIDAQDITLDKGKLNAETKVGKQGNISLNNAETLLLRNNSQITTNASASATGGNISISAQGIAALDNSDISAKAERGQGGNIQVTTQGIFSEPDSQITATSELGIDGTVTLNTPDVDPASGIFELPDVPIDAEDILAQDLCKLQEEKIARGSSFIITGRGGMTPTSADALGNVDRIVNWASNGINGEVPEEANKSDRPTQLQQIPREQSQSVESDRPTQKSPTEQTSIQQSQGMVVAKDGSTWLTTNAYNQSSQNSTIVHPDCRTLESAAKK